MRTVQFRHARRTLQRRQGLALVYAAVVMFAMCGLASLGVDLGRVVLAKTQLQAATDAAARAAALQLSPGSNTTTTFSAASTKANAIFGANTVDGCQLALGGVNGSVSTGSWDGTSFTASNAAAANAIQVSTVYDVPLIWANMVGRGTYRIAARVISQSDPGTPPYGLVGINGMNLNTTCLIDSYDPSSGTYAQTRSLNAAIASDGNWNIGSGVTVDGNLYYGGTQTSAPSNGTVTGQRLPVPSSPTLSSLYPAVTTPGNAVAMGNHNGGSLILVAGTNYSFTTLSLGSGDTLTISGSGAVHIYVNGNVTISGTATINSGGNPGNCQIFNVSSSGLNLSGSATIYADMYGPNSPVNFNLSGSFYGSIVGSTVSFGTSGSSAAIHCDRTTGSSSSTCEIVQ